jgi:methionyl-tRNA formyltransferase
MSHPETVGLISNLKPDVVFVFGLSQLIPKEILGIPPMGCIGTHPALLPRNRGRHPLIWAIIEGLRESGLTFFYLDEGTDSGDILWQKSFVISPDDDAGTLYKKIKHLAGEALAEILPKLSAGKTPRFPQDHRMATYWRKRTDIDGEIDWTASGTKTHALIRALTRPYAGAHTFLDGHKMIIWRSSLQEVTVHMNEPLTATRPGQIVEVKPDSLLVRTGDGFLKIIEWESAENIKLVSNRCFGKAKQI